MALQKNIKEVESTEAGFVANAAAKNDGFLTDVIGYPMIKRRGNDYDYWFPEKSRDELGTYTYYDKTVKDLTALNDCIVQRRLSSYGDADTYLDFSTDDQAVLNVGGVPFLTVAESESAAIGTLGGNLALGANTISRDGAADKGIGVSSTGAQTLIATPYTIGDIRTVLRLYDDTAFEEGVGAGINLYGKINVNGDYSTFGGIKVSKENEVSNDYSASFYIQTRKRGSDPANALRLDSSQNGYIKSKLMVGSLDETPDNQLVVYNAGAVDTFIQIANGATELEGGLFVGVEADGSRVLRVDYGNSLRFQSKFTSIIEEMATLRYTDRTEFKVNGEIQCDALVVYNAEAVDTFIQVANGVTGSEHGLIVGVEADGNAALKIGYGRLLEFLGESIYGIEPMATLYNSDDGTARFQVFGNIYCDDEIHCRIIRNYQNGYIGNKLMVGSLGQVGKDPENQLVVYNSGATDSFIQVTNGVTGSEAEDGLIVGVEADGDAVLKVDYGRYLKFQSESMYGPIEMATLRYTGTTLFNVNGTIQCDAFRLDQDPYTGTITPNKYIIINCNGTDYKIPVVAA